MIMIEKVNVQNRAEGANFHIGVTTIFKGQGVFFPYKKGGLASKRAYIGTKIQLTNERLTCSSYFPFLIVSRTFLEIPVSRISYVRPEKVRKFPYNLNIIRIGYKEGGEEKEIYLSLPEKDYELFRKGFAKLV